MCANAVRKQDRIMWKRVTKSYFRWDSEEAFPSLLQCFLFERQILRDRDKKNHLSMK